MQRITQRVSALNFYVAQNLPVENTSKEDKAKYRQTALETEGGLPFVYSDYITKTGPSFQLIVMLSRALHNVQDYYGKDIFYEKGFACRV